MTNSPSRLRAAVAALALGSIGLAAVLGQAPASAALPSRTSAAVDPALLGAAGDVGVVVRLGPSVGQAARSEVASLGGRVTRDLPLIDGFAATLPASAVERLARVPGVAVVSADRPVRVQGAATSSASSAATTGSLAPQVLQAPRAWSAGRTGRGVTVALVDTGIAPDLPDLAGRVVTVTDPRTGAKAPCHNLSGEDGCSDTYGHGTFMAGLIAGNGAAAGGRATGTAPEANVLSVKVAGASGAADVSTVLAAIQWVVSFRERYGIRVLNLSVGTDSKQSWRDDPLNYAVQRAWAAGITVVVAAANTGPTPGSIAKPGDDPWVVTVGAVDDNQTVGLKDDRVPDFSSRGPTAHGVAKPDVVAPGGHVRSLRAPESTLDEDFPPADEASAYRTASGTSMAAALVSGAAALALQGRPWLTPDRLKHALVSAARPVASDDPSTVGRGMVDAYRTAVSPAAGAANAGLQRSTGRGDLGLTRGSLELYVDHPGRTALTGRQTAQLLLWDPVGFTTGSWTPTTWYTSVHGTVGWNTALWTGEFEGNNWTGNNWTGEVWDGASSYGKRVPASYGRWGSGSGSYGAWD